MILVDPRIGSKQFFDLIKARVNCDVRYARPNLHGGDFAFLGNGPQGPILIGIELKTLSDMLGSMRSGRLAGDQLIKMNADCGYGVIYVIIQGEWKANKEGLLIAPKWTKGRKKEWGPIDSSFVKGRQTYHRYAELDKFICSLEATKNIIITRSMDEGETAWQVVNRYLWWQKEWDEHDSTDPIKQQTEILFTKASLLRMVAAQLPGIGWHRSKDVERWFRSVHGMVNAPMDSWEAIPGIGSKTARKVWEAIRDFSG